MSAASSFPTVPEEPASAATGVVGGGASGRYGGRGGRGGRRGGSSDDKLMTGQDSVEAMLLGERVAIEILRDQKATYNEPFAGFTFTRFDGTSITI